MAIRWRPWIDAVLVLVLAALTVNRYAPAGFSGDVILYSVMSLQNVTLFFWEQNRLLNVGPALTSVLRDPALNVFANLMFPAAVFFALLRYVAGQAVAHAESVAPAGCRLGAREVFLLLSLTVFAVLRPDGIFDYVIWHVEYPLSWLLLALAYFLWFKRDPVRSKSRAMLALSVLMFVATGVNYSILLPAGALVCWRLWATRQVGRDAVIFAALALAAFLLWALISHFFPGPGQGAYAGFNPCSLVVALPKVLSMIAGVIYLPGLALVFGAVRALRLVAGRYRQSAAPGFHVRMLLFLFAGAWLLFFAGNSWVAANGYHFRYFAPVLFVGLILLAVELAWARVRPTGTARMLAVPVLLVLLLAHLARPFVPLHDYEFFKRAEAAGVEGVSLYGGDFNLAWAAVMRGLLRGEPAFGIAERASGNEVSLLAQAGVWLAADGVLRVGCLDAEVQRCVDQANTHIGPLRLRDVVTAGRGSGSAVLTLAPREEEPIVRRGATLAALPGAVGHRDKVGVAASGERGFLVFGDYRPLTPGRYRLQVFGDAAVAEGAWVDVVSNGGRNRHLRSPLDAAETGTERVLAEGVLVLDERVRDIEIRVFVTERDRVVLTGYELTPGTLRTD